MCVLRHPRVEMATQTEDDWDAAGAVGYGFTSRGAEGIREALDVIRARPCVTRKQGGPQAIFGRLYQWLQYNKSGKDRGPIRDVVREYFLDTMPIEPGTKLFGEPVEVRRRHSVASLARQFGLNYRTMNRALVLTGVMPDGEADVLDRLLTVDAVAGERLADRMRRSLSMAAMPEYLNCGRLQAEALIRHRVIPRIGENPSTGQFGLNSIAVEDVDAFLDRFRSAGRQHGAAEDGVHKRGGGVEDPSLSRHRHHQARACRSAEPRRPSAPRAEAQVRPRRSRRSSGPAARWRHRWPPVRHPGGGATGARSMGCPEPDGGNGSGRAGCFFRRSKGRMLSEIPVFILIPASSKPSPTRMSSSRRSLQSVKFP